MGSIDKACISGFLCRLCSEMHRIVIHIYGDQGQRLCLVEKINGYLPITISPTDPLPKTICTTCLRRVEQHYDLLMRLSRIKEKRIVGVDKYRHRFELPELSEISSPEMSEEDLYHSDDDTHRRQQAQSTQSTQRTSPVESSTSTGVALNACNHSISRSINSDEGTVASTSASALDSISRTMELDEIASTSSSIHITQSLGNVGGSPEVNPPIHND